jgi:anti-sigma regulatory factor (Ser/Thr protein kinase)
MTDLLATVTIPRGLEAPSAARDFVAEQLAVVGAAELVPDATLMVSELVTNAVVHTACPDVKVELLAAGGRLRCAVIDGDPRNPPEWRPLDTSTVGGLGLRIVAATADSWGVETGDADKRVWFELRPG